MITLITGVPGAGKTLRAVWWIQKLVAEGRPVFSNIEGLTLPGVRPMPDDWRECADGSVIAIDEVQNRWPAHHKGGRSNNEEIQALETHRHRGMDLILTTQHPSLMHVHVRRLVGRHEHVVRQFGAKKVKIHMLERAWDPLKPAELAQSHLEWFSYPKDLFKVYKSAEIHTHKFHIPKAVRWMLLGVVLLIAGIAYWSGGLLRVWQGKPAVTAKKGLEHAKYPSTQVAGSRGATGTSRDSTQGPPPGQALVPINPITAGVLGCISSRKRCTCYGETRDSLVLGEAVCRQIVKGEIPLKLAPVSSQAVAASPGLDILSPVAEAEPLGHQLVERNPRQEATPVVPPELEIGRRFSTFPRRSNPM